MKTHPTQDYYFKRSQERKLNKAKSAKAKNLFLSVVISLIACAPLVASFYIITNN